VVEARFTPEFDAALIKYSNVKKSAQTKIGILCQNPLGFGEPLKYDLEGLSSIPVKKGFIIIYVYCRECRIKGYHKINNCHGCEKTPDEVIKFLTIGPHDKAYKASKTIDLP